MIEPDLERGGLGEGVDKGRDKTKGEGRERRRREEKKERQILVTDQIGWPRLSRDEK